MEQTFVLLNWTQFPGLFSMMNKKQDQFKDHRIAPDVYKPEEMRKNSISMVLFITGILFFPSNIPRSDLLLLLILHCYHLTFKCVV